MRLSDDYEDHGSGLTPTVVSAIVAVTIFVVVILTVVLIINRKPASHQQNNTAAQTENVQQAGNQQTAKYPDTQDLITGSTLTPSDLDFWDMYPETTATPMPSENPPSSDNPFRIACDAVTGAPLLRVLRYITSISSPPYQYV